ncbi:unnamed protein product, partial [Soboliphyme baturini]|uniref:Conserved plasma membrane protein n=1 Tax=Soboliphyme baturini TaxID=241478 RepID=A0A183IVD0_9BILA
KTLLSIITNYCFKACDWGSRVNRYGICTPCEADLILYDRLYLGFVAITPFLLHLFFIAGYRAYKRSKALTMVQLLSAALETFVSALSSLFVFDPKGSFQLKTCGVESVEDWYTMFLNPNINYTMTVFCTQEAVYPLYTLPFVYYFFSLVSLAVLRPLLLRAFRQPLSGAYDAVFAALDFYPILAVTHAVFAGLICMSLSTNALEGSNNGNVQIILSNYAYPYLILFSTLMLNAAHLAAYREQTFCGIIKETFRCWQNISMLLLFLCLYCYSVASLTEFTNPFFHGGLLGLSPIPSLFYVLTVRLTNPSKIGVIPA